MERLAGIYDATSPDLSAFRNAGGKLIIWAGWADQAIPSFTQVDYYAAVERQMGGFVRSQAFTRLYMVPGGYHCLSGGDPTTMPVFLVPLINWVENAQAPAALTLPVTGQTTGTKISSLTVHPFDALAPAPKNKGLNSNYQQYRSADLYTRDHLMVCEVKLGNYVCTTSH
jgi:feruloyl esterase